METYIKNRLIDITCQSELTPSLKLLIVGNEGYPSHPAINSWMLGINSRL
ncbi:hypothetical protein ACFLZ3_05540 [Candidatus Omnitrophota bacterium]